MKTTDFMVGDWLRTSRGNAKVIAVDKIGLTFKIDGGDFDIDKDDEEEWFCPIPLTEEILEKNKIKLEVGPGGLYQGIIEGLNCKIEFNIINFVHELQHALRLCGIEKEIEL